MSNCAGALRLPLDGLVSRILIQRETMMTRVLSLLIIVFAMSVGQGAAASGDVGLRSPIEGQVPPPATIDDIAWLAGRWTGEGLGGLSEEVIAPGAGGQMMGMFRQAEMDGAVKFYEFYLFVETEGSLALRIKHFTPALHGWEEKEDYEEFALVAIEETAVYFDGLTYALSGPDELTSVVDIEGQGVARFRFDRQVAPAEGR